MGIPGHHPAFLPVHCKIVSFNEAHRVWSAPFTPASLSGFQLWACGSISSMLPPTSWVSRTCGVFTTRNTGTLKVRALRCRCRAHGCGEECALSPSPVHGGSQADAGRIPPSRPEAWGLLVVSTLLCQVNQAYLGGRDCTEAQACGSGVCVRLAGTRYQLSWPWSPASPPIMRGEKWAQCEIQRRPGASM